MSKASIGVGKSQSDKNGLVNINVSQRGEDPKTGEDYTNKSQISIILMNQMDASNLKAASRERKLRNLVKKQNEMFLFGQKTQKVQRQWRQSQTRNISILHRSALSHSGLDPLLKEEAKKISDGLFALRRANKNRRSQLSRATQERKERLINSQIPGVDYSH